MFSLCSDLDSEIRACINVLRSADIFVPKPLTEDIEMKRKRLIVMIGPVVAAILAFRPVKTFIDIDICLDRGGAWDEQTETCVGFRPDNERR